MSSRKSRRKPEEERVLPFYNLSFARQIEVLKTYVAFFEKKRKGAHYKDIASIAGVHSTQVSGCRKFWRSLGFLEEQDGTDIPTETTMEFVRRLEWGEEDAAWSFFRDSIGNTWFSDHVMMVLGLQKAMSREDLANSLGSAAGIHRKGKHTVESLNLLIELLINSKIIAEEAETGKFVFHPETAVTREPLELPGVKEDLIVIVMGNERYGITVGELERLVREHGKKVAKEYRVG